MLHLIVDMKVNDFQVQGQKSMICCTHFICLQHILILPEHFVAHALMTLVLVSDDANQKMD